MTQSVPPDLGPKENDVTCVLGGNVVVAGAVECFVIGERRLFGTCLLYTSPRHAGNRARRAGSGRDGSEIRGVLATGRRPVEMAHRHLESELLSDLQDFDMLPKEIPGGANDEDWLDRM